MTEELKRFEQWWDAEDDIPNDGPYTPDTPIQFAWAGWQAALAQPEQPKVRTGNCLRIGVCASEGHKIAPQRTWVGLTDEEVINVMPDDDTPMSLGEAFSKFAELIEAKLKELNT